MGAEQACSEEVMLGLVFAVAMATGSFTIYPYPTYFEGQTVLFAVDGASKGQVAFDLSCSGGSTFTDRVVAGKSAKTRNPEYTWPIKGTGYSCNIVMTVGGTPVDSEVVNVVG